MVKHWIIWIWKLIRVYSSWFNGHSAPHCKLFCWGESKLFQKITSWKGFKGPALSVMECHTNAMCYKVNFLTDTLMAPWFIVSNIVAQRLVECVGTPWIFQLQILMAWNSATKISMLIDMQLQTLDTHDAEQRRSLGGNSAKTLE